MLWVGALGALASSMPVHAQMHAPSLCGDQPVAQTNLGVWPQGKIPYAFEPGYKFGEQVKRAMVEWEGRSGNIIDFVEDVTPDVKVRIHDCMRNAKGEVVSGESFGYTGCSASGCDSYLCPENMLHELGHAIGLVHQFERNDRDHYVRLNYAQCRSTPVGTSPPTFGRSADDESDFGPYNYQSVMHYAATHPDITRWDGTSICHMLLAKSQCGDGVAGPFGSIKDGDGASVIELYGAQNGWSRFRRTFGSGNPTPYTTDLVPEVDDLGLAAPRIDPESSPAIETWGGESSAVYVRMQGGAIAKKYWDTATESWSAWSLLAAVPKAGTSDPAVTSWGNGRTDLVVRGGDTVYIMSTPSWNTWQSLGAPPSGADSAPAITSKGVDELMVVVRARDARLYYRECTAECSGNSGTWSGWAAIGGHVFTGKPALVSRGDMIDLVAHGLTDTVWLTEYRSFNGVMGWAEWGDEGRALVLGNAGCADCNSPALGAHSEDTLDIYVRGLDNHVWVLTWDPNSRTELRTSVLGGVVQTSPAVASVLTPGRADLFASMLEETSSRDYRAGIWRKTRSSF